MDILVHMQRNAASFIAKSTVRNFPCIGTIAWANGTLFIERDNKEGKKKMLEDIVNRQAECE